MYWINKLKKIAVNSCWTDVDGWGENIPSNDECRTLSIIDRYRCAIECILILSLWSFVIYLVAMIEEYNAKHVNVDRWCASIDYVKESLI